MYVWNIFVYVLISVTDYHLCICYASFHFSCALESDQKENKLEKKKYIDELDDDDECTDLHYFSVLMRSHRSCLSDRNLVRDLAE